MRLFAAGQWPARDWLPPDPPARAERLVWFLRWPASLVLALWLGRQAMAGMPLWQVAVGFGLLVLTLAWQVLLARVMARGQGIKAWAYASVSLDLALLTAYLCAEARLYPSPQGFPAAGVMLYPLMLLLAALRLDSWLLAWGLLLGLGCCNLAFLLGSPLGLSWAGLGVNLVLAGFAGLLLILPLVFGGGLHGQPCSWQNRHEKIGSGGKKTANPEQEAPTPELWPICSHCKKIRDEQGQWQALEAYLSVRVGADFSHSICPECMAYHYPEVYHSLAGRVPGLAVKNPGPPSLPLTNK